MKKGDMFTAPGRLFIEVLRVAGDQSWADIRVTQSDGRTWWTKRQPAPFPEDWVKRMPWDAGTQEPDCFPPRMCIRSARDALNKAYSHPGISDGQHALIFIAEAVDWQRRALEQMIGDEVDG